MDQVVGAHRRAVFVSWHGDRVTKGADGKLLVLVDRDVDREGCFHGRIFAPFLGPVLRSVVVPFIISPSVSK